MLGREHELVVGASYRQERFDGHGGWGSLFNKDGTPTGPMDPTQWDPSSTLKPRLNTSLWGMKLDQEQKGAYLTTRLNLADPLKVILGGRLTGTRPTPIPTATRSPATSPAMPG